MVHVSLCSLKLSARNCLTFRDVNCARHRGKSQESKMHWRKQMEFQQEKKGFYARENRIDTTVKGGFQKVRFHCRSFWKILGAGTLQEPSFWMVVLLLWRRTPRRRHKSPGRAAQRKNRDMQYSKRVWFSTAPWNVQLRSFSNIFLVPIFHCKLCLCTHRCGNKY